MNKKETCFDTVHTICGLVVCLLAAAGCAGPQRAAQFQPYENFLEIVSDFQRHVNNDTYRFRVAKDITGLNINKATLIRLINYEKLYPNKMQSAVNFSKAQVFERLGEFDQAIVAYQLCLGTPSALTPLTQENLALVSRFAEMKGYELEKKTLEDYLKEYEYKINMWQELIETRSGTPYEYLAREQQELVEEELVEFVGQNIYVIEDGIERAIELHRNMVTKHAESKKINVHYLRFADFFASLAITYARQFDPEGLNFDYQKFDYFSNSALNLYSIVASKDGIIEKVEAEGKLMAFKAYVNKIQEMSRTGLQ